MIQEIELRRADAAECVAGWGSSQAAIRESIAVSDINYTSSYRGEVVAVWGVRVDNVLLNAVSMWCLTTPVVDRCGVFFARESRRMLERLLHQYDSIDCLVYHAHIRARRWLMWLGFDEVSDVWLNGELFIRDRIGRV